MSIFLAWLALASVQLAATMSPGPAFVVAVRSAMIHDRKIGIFTSIGLGAGVGAHVLFVLVGISYLIARSVFLYSLIKYIGAIYLIYIGIKALRTRKNAPPAADIDIGGAISKESATLSKAFVTGFMTNLLNPKAVIFFTAVYTQFITPDTSHFIHALYGMTSVAIEILWFSGVVMVLSNPHIKHRFMACAHWIERVCGGLMVALGVKLALSR